MTNTGFGCLCMGAWDCSTVAIEARRAPVMRTTPVTIRNADTMPNSQ